jgi:pilus assembly protein CpaF
MSFEVIIPFLKPIKHLLEAETVSEVMVNPDSSVWVEESGQIQLLPGLRFHEGGLLVALEVISNRFGKKLDADSPILNLRLPDGSRMAALIPPLVHPEPMMTIRKFTSRDFTMGDLIARGMLTEEQAQVLTDAVRRGDNLLISGGTGSGKTTLLNVLADSVPHQERILIIEDTAELHIRKPHVVSAEAQLDTHKTQISFADLLKASLRHRPDRIILGEIRGTEARVLLDAMNTGHRGTLSTIHASSAVGALRRLGSLAMRGTSSVTKSDVEEEIASCIALVAHIERMEQHRQVREILVVPSPAEGQPPDLNGNGSSYPG